MLAAALVLRGISLAGSPLPPLAPTDLAVGAGEHVALLETPDGGAETVMRIAAGFVRPDIGRVVQRGIDCTDFEPGERGSRWIPSGLGLLAALTAAEDVALSIVPERASRAERRRVARAALERWGAAALAGRRPVELRPAEAARVALVRAIAGGSDLLIADRPFLGVPVGERQPLRELLDAMRRELSLAVLERCDDPREALARADRIAIFDAGRLVQFDTPDRVWSSPVSVAVARVGGEAEVFAGRLVARDGAAGRVETEIGVLSGVVFGDPAVGDAVTATVRPERIDLLDVDARETGTAARIAADYVERRIAGSLERLTYALGERRFSLVRPDRGPARLALPGRSHLTIAEGDVWIHPLGEGSGDTA